MEFFKFAQEQGFALFPCVADGKEPLPGFAWKQDSSHNPTDWHAWHGAGHNLAIDAAKSGLLIIDVDASKVGRETAWAAWCEQCAKWGVSPIMPMTQTARGGWHITFRRPAGVAPEELNGWVILMKDGSGGELIGARNRAYVIAPGSTFQGKPYSPMPNAPAPAVCPPGLFDAFRLPTVNTTGDTGDRDCEDVAGLFAFLDTHNEFESEPEWFKALGAIKLACGDEGIKAARQITWTEVTEEQLAAKWNRLPSANPGNKVLCTIATYIKRARDLGWRGHIRKGDKWLKDALATAAQFLPPPPPPAASLLMPSATFIAGFVPPDYVLDRVLQRGFCYSMTAATGTGKTALGMRIAAHVSIGRMVADLEVTKGAVIYLAGENPTDVQMRWLGVTQDMGIDPETADVHFITKRCPLHEISEQLKNEVQTKGLRPVLIVVDTSAAYNGAEDENSNTQMVAHARQVRQLTELPGAPCVLVLCHPTKRATDEDLIPRGGGGFLAEVDGNISVRRVDKLVVAAALGKFRGPEFPPLSFELQVVEHPKLKDTRGRSIPTVVARAVDAAVRAKLEGEGDRRESEMLDAIDKNRGKTTTELAIILGWRYGSGTPNHVQAGRVLERLQKQKLVEERRKRWHLTQRGQKDLNEVEAAADTQAAETAAAEAIRAQYPRPN